MNISQSPASSSNPLSPIAKFASLLLLTASLVTAAHAADPNAKGTLRVGAARVDITPPYADKQSQPTGKYENERLYVRAIVLDNGLTRAALIGAEQGNISDAIWADASKQIAAELQCPVANIIISATHTHSQGGPGSAPGSPNSGGPPPPNPAILPALIEAARQAKATLQPALMGYGTGMTYLNVNRDAIDPTTHLWSQEPNLLAASDKTVAVLKFVKPTGEPIAVYVNYAMHPINGYLTGFTSSDFPGAMSRWVEQAYEDKPVVVFSQGASGDQNPLYMRPSTNAMASKSGMTIPGDVLVRESVEQPLREGQVPAGPLDPKVMDRLESWMTAEGMVLGEEVIRVITDTTRTSASVRIRGDQATITCPGRKRLDKGREGMTGQFSDGDPVNIRLSMIGIGDVALTGVDAEIYTLIGQRTRKESPLANTVFVTLANGSANSGYIPDDASFSHNSFQVLSSHLKPGCAEKSISDTLADMIVKYQQ